MTFILYPAIDLRRGQVVRLYQGDPAQQTVYGDDPAGVARRWADQGAEWLHVVNLDGALTSPPRLPSPETTHQSQERGETRGKGSISPYPGDSPSVSGIEGRGGEGEVNLRCLAEIRAAAALPIQFGGGVRTVADVELARELGATRVVLGTVAVRQPEIVAAAIAQFGPEAIVVGIDARDGFVATHGWQETSALEALTVALRMAELGVRRIVYTDISRDGTLTGVNLEATVSLARASGMRIIASGGVAGLADIRRLAAHQSDGIEGVIVGQALYTGAIGLQEALMAGRTA